MGGNRTTQGTDTMDGIGGAREVPASARRVVDSPVGRLLVIAGTRGVVRVAFEQEDFDSVLAAVSQQAGAGLEPAPHVLDAAVRELGEYFSGQRRDFQVPVDLALSSGFRRTVQEGLRTIGYGRTATYKDLAEQLGNPGAVRAVGSACATNPLPVVVPCHRVVRTDGGLGGYLGGLQAKTFLLELERDTLRGRVPA